MEPMADANRETSRRSAKPAAMITGRRRSRVERSRGPVPTLSIIVPTYNHGHVLPRCLDSVLTQRTAGWECVVVDDGSTDETGAVLGRYTQADGRVRRLRQPNRGVSAARNAGLDAGRGEWVMFLDADDYLQPGALEGWREAIPRVAGRASIARGDLASTTTSARAPLEIVVQDLFYATLGFAPPLGSLLLQNAYFDRALLTRIGGFSTDLSTAEDRELLIRATALSPVAGFNRPAGHYCHGDGADDRSLHDGRKIAAHQLIYGRLTGWPEVTARLAAPGLRADFERRRRAYLAMVDAASAVRSGDSTRAVGHLRAVMRACPEPASHHGLLSRFFYFLFFPKSDPGRANATSARHVGALLSALGSDAADTPLRTILLERLQWYTEAAVEVRA